MDTISDDYIRMAAYYIWEREGRPEGMDFEHWVKAKAEAAKAEDKGTKKTCKKTAKKTTAKKPAKKKVAAKKKTAKK